MLRTKIINELLKMGYVISNSGSLYLVDIIEILHQRNSLSPVFQSFNLDKDIYVILANKYNTNWYTIKSNITKATNTMNSFQSIQQDSSTHIKWTPKNVITYILEKI